jgi:UDP-N-acetylmuramoylalanine--D-glutamate ligase
VTERSKLSWSDLAGARVAVWGFGREGSANLRKLRSMGVEPVLVDDNPSGPDVLPTAGEGLEALGRCDVVVKTPGISRYRPEVDWLSDRGIPVVGGLGLWLQEADRGRVVCVTGTKGKSTVASIAGHLIAGLGKRVLVGGNIGVAPYDPEVTGDYDYWVIEVSSYQATDLPCSTPVVAVTSLHPDHLPWHGGVERYYRDKLSVCSQPGAELTIANGDSEQIRAHADLLGPKVEWVTLEAAEWTEPLGLLGAHNRRNALIARRCLAALGIAADDAALTKAAEGYPRLPSRLTDIGTVDGVSFVDDSLSTNVLPTLAALEAFPGRRVALIAGGQDRGIDYAPLAAGIMTRDAPTLVLTVGDSGPRIRAAFENAAFENAAFENAAVEKAAVEPSAAWRSGGSGILECPDLDYAVRSGFAWARPSGVVLLSPAAPSFGQFRDYRDRGDAFARVMRELTSAE